MWARLADEWGCPIGEVLARTPCSELPVWVEIMRRKDEARDKAEWYHAQTAFETHQVPYRVWGVKSPVKDFEQFLITFGKKKMNGPKPDQIADPPPQVNESKERWASIAGGRLDASGNIVPGPRGLLPGVKYVPPPADGGGSPTPVGRPLTPAEEATRAALQAKVDAGLGASFQGPADRPPGPVSFDPHESPVMRRQPRQ